MGEHKRIKNCDMFVYDCASDECAAYERAAKQYGITYKRTEESVTQENARLMKGCRCVSVSHQTRVTFDILRTWKRLGIVYLSTRSIGYNHIDMEAAARLGITVENVMYSPDSVAEYTILLILMALRRMKKQLEMTREHDFSLQEQRGVELGELTVGVVGCGRIGRCVIERLRPFGCRILAYDEFDDNLAEYVSYETLLRESDIITYHVPLTDETRHMLGEQNMNWLKHGCYLINTSRGAVIERQALLQNLRNHMIAGAALDVVEGDEEYFYQDCRYRKINSQLEELCGMENVTITPHNAFHTTRAQRDMIVNSVANCKAYLARAEDIRKII